MIVENTFSCIKDLAKDYLPFPLKFGTFIFTKIKYPNDERIIKIKAPILFITGKNDKIVPAHHMEKLFNFAIHAKFKEKVCELLDHYT